MRRTLLLAVFILPSPAWAALGWEALPQAVAQAPGAAALRAEASAAQARRGGWGRSFAPRLEAFGAARGQGAAPAANEPDGLWPEAGLRGRVNLWRQGQDRARTEQVDALARQAQAQALAGEQALLLQARQTWLQAWAARRRLQALQAAQARCAEDLQRIRRQAAAGLVPRSDVLALELQADELDQHAFDEAHLADEAEHHLAALLGLPPEDAEGLVDGVGLAWPPAQAQRRPRRAEQAQRLAAAEALQAQALGAPGLWQPSLDLEAQARAGRVGYGLGEAGDWQGLAVLSLAWDGASAPDKERAWLRGQAQASRQALKAQQAADAVKLTELRHALASWVGRQSAVEQRSARSARFRQAVLEENARGVRDSRDLMDSNQALLEADSDLILAQVRAWSVWAELQAFEAQP